MELSATQWKALLDIVDFGRLAADLVSRGKDLYDEDVQLRLAGEAIIARLGGAVSRLPVEVFAEHPAIPFRSVKDMRNLVSHEYHRIDPDLVWATLATKVPSFIAQIESLLEQ